LERGLTDAERDLIDNPRKHKARTVWLLPLSSYGRKETHEFSGQRYG
jgi:hypothetical protein